VSFFFFNINILFLFSFSLRDGESNPGHLRDRQRCYQLHHRGIHLLWLPWAGLEPATPGLEVRCAIHCATRAITLQITKKPKGLPGFEPGSRDSESLVLTITPQAQCNYKKKMKVKKIFFFFFFFFFLLRRPGIEPGPRAWKARILTIELSTHILLLFTHCGARTRDHTIKSRALYRLS
jgi:hypothetical protein